jgi:glycosyltransferase involved in cell wall biosynthesis
MNEKSKTAVLHAALHPVTGPWSVMRELAAAQLASGRYAGVGIAVIVDSTWPAAYREEARSRAVAFYETTLPRTFGTAAFLLQRVRPPPWRAWIADLAQRAGVRRVVVHLHNAWMSGVFLPLPRVEGVEAPVVATFHGVNEHFESKPARLRVHRWMAQRLLRHGARLTSVDGLNTALAEKLFGLPRSDFEVIPNGIAPFAGPSREIEPAAGTLTVGHVGSMIPQKGWQIVAEAGERLRAEGVPIRVLLAGGGPEEAKAAAWAARHAAWAEYLGHVADPRARVMTRLDVLCLMSQWEGLPMSIVEAMSVGTPVVATDVGGVREAVEHGETGLLVERAPDALAAALLDLWRDPVRRAAMGRKAQARFLERFTLDRVVERYDALYAEARA